MNTDLFIRTYTKDAKWLVYCLRSVEKFAQGFRQTVVVCGENDASVIGPIVRDCPGAVLKLDKPSGNGYADQLTSKLSCDKYTDADYFLHIDDDCVLTHVTKPGTHMTGGKADVWYDFYEGPSIKGCLGAYNRKPETERALGVPNIEVETTRRFPFIYPRWLYAETQKQIEKAHGTSFREYILKNSGPFSEFNALGALAYYRFPDKYCLRPMSDYTKKPPGLLQFWSHSGLTPGEESVLQQITAGYRA